MEIPDETEMYGDFICPFVVLDLTDLGATIVVAPGQMPGNFLPFPDADCLSFVVKLVHASVTFQPCFDFRVMPSC